jgi:peptidoglycan hydrolase-like protein with peptidoglycan-binding domain
MPTPAEKPQEKPTITEGSSNSKKENEDKPKDSESSSSKKTNAYSDTVKIVQQQLNKLGYGKLTEDGILGPATTKAIKQFQKEKGLTVDGIIGPKTLEALRKALSGGGKGGGGKGQIKAIAKYKAGGLVDFTGPAWVDGTKSKPEAFLSASDTAMLKSKIFSNSDGSLKALVSALENITKGTSDYKVDNSATEQIIIQNAQVNLQSGVISNDYDARKAGEKALEEMVRIARKTTNRVVSR